MDKTRRRVGILTAKANEDLNLLLFGNPEESLKSIDEEMEPLRSELSAPEARKKAFRRIKSGMESNSKELLVAYKLIDKLVLPALISVFS
ncbi:hypothetical protein RHMOL_Rhmol07G0093500 [Rhododendron molle]|uniref:Uncharacterized protein n=1 Tax=Rhododendron molle TaxID=49168 RepID=A0ACC0N047_RHOML|nr:hypothetical protein RHMOL_Rhmol07G0093500 [Rhododendron molle]